MVVGREYGSQRVALSAGRPVVVMQSATSVAEPLSDPKVVAMITPCPEGLEPSAPTACGKGMGKAAADGWVG